LAGRVLIIGLDAGTFDILLPFVERDLMPNLRRLIENGVCATLRSTVPAVTSPAWPAMVTGLNPGKLGLFAMLNKRVGAQYDFAVASNCYHHRAIWSLIGRYGKRSIVCNVPVTYPPAPINGCLVSGMLTPKGQLCTYPSALMSELEAKGLLIDWEAQRDIDSTIALADEETRLALFLMENNEWDLFMTVFRATDMIFHLFPEREREVEALFARVDAHLGRLIERADEQDTVFVVSDHGMTLQHEVINVNSLLQQAGLLKKREAEKDALNFAHSVIERVKQNRLLQNPIFKNPLTRKLSQQISQRVESKRIDYGRDGRRLSRLAQSQIDWSGTKCFFVDLGYGSGVYLNLKGREPEGTVEPGEEYQALRSHITELLSQQSGVIVRRREEVYSGPFVEMAPDLLLWTSDEKLGLDAKYLDLPVRQKRETKVYHHTGRGILIACGPDIRRGCDLDRASIFDIAPTVLHLLGAPLPDDVDGAVLRRIFREDSELASKAASFQPALRLPEQEVDVESDDEVIKDRLRDLGYLH